MNVRFVYVLSLASLLLTGGGCSTPVFQKVYPVDASTGQPLTNLPPVGVIVSPATTGLIQGIKGASETIPTPASPFVAIGATLASLVLAEIARRKTAQLTSAQSALTAVVTGVELGNHPATKESVARIATATGAESTLAPVVQTVVGRLSTLKKDQSSPTL